MKFIVNQGALRTAIERCKPMVDKRAAQPVLANLLLRVEGERLRVHACNLREEITTKVSVHGAVSGAVCVPASDLSSRVGAMPQCDLVFEQTVDALHVSAKGMGRKFRLESIPGGEFPKLHEPTGEAVRIDAATFGRLIAAVKHSVGTDETRQSTNCAYFRSHGGTLTMLSNDGHCASVISIAADMPSLSLCIPHRALLSVQSLCDEAEQIELHSDQSRMFFTAAETTIAALLPDMPFPEHYRQVLPDTNGKGLTVDRLALFEATKAVSVSADAFNRIELRTGDFGKLNLMCGHDGTDSIPAEVDDGFSTEVTCNAQYLATTLQSIETPTVRIQHGDKEFDPIIVLPVDGKDPERMCVVMPMRK